VKRKGGERRERERERDWEWRERSALVMWLSLFHVTSLYKNGMRWQVEQQGNTDKIAT
jgi:hypothetical protein